jgi:two-component system, LytTR family, response regulator
VTKLIRALIADDEPLARAHLRALLAERPDVEVIGECGDGLSAVQAIRAEAPDLVLLDIQMPELDGLGVVRELGVDRLPAIVFVTAYDEHALAAFEVHAVDYLLKPVDRSRFASAVDRAIASVRARGAGERDERLARLVEQLDDSNRPLERIAVKTDGRVLFVKISDIDWIEAADDYVRFHIGKIAYLQRDTLSRIERRLPASRFLRIHRSIIVNIDRIRELQPWFQGDWVVRLADGTSLHSGKSYRENLRALLDRAT